MENKKTVVITGAGSGFGKLLAISLAKQGYRVLATMRRHAERQQSFPQIDGLEFFELDICRADQREELRQFISSQFQGRLDVLVNNAGYGAYGALEDANDQYIDEQMATNTNAQAKLTRDLLPFLRESKGRIFFLSSIMGLVAMPLSSLYCASKFALEGLAMGLRYELAPYQVQVSVIAPGRHRTDFAKNMKWPDVDFEQSAYRRFYQGMRQMMAKFTSGQGVNPDQVVNCLSRSLKQKRMAPRYLVGKDAKALYLLHKILPHGLYITLTTRLYSQGLLK